MIEFTGIYRKQVFPSSGSTCKKLSKAEFIPQGCAVGSSHLHALGQALCWLRGELVPDHGALLQGQEQSSEPLGCPGELSRVPAAALEGKAAAHVDALVPDFPTFLFLSPGKHRGSRYPRAGPQLPGVPLLAEAHSPHVAPPAAPHGPGLRGQDRTTGCAPTRQQPSRLREKTCGFTAM